MRNINWLLQYWGCVPPVPADQGAEGGWDYSGCYPNPVCAEYGFKTRCVSFLHVSGQVCNLTAFNRPSAATARKRKGGAAAASSSSSLAAIQWLDEDDEDNKAKTKEGTDSDTAD